MSTSQTTISIPYWLTNGAGWQVSSQGSCRVTVTRNYGNDYATVSTYWGYCSPGGSQAAVTCSISIGGTTKSEQLFGTTVHSAGTWYYANGTTFTVKVSDSAGSLTANVYMRLGSGTSGMQSSTASASLSYDSRGETTPSVDKTSVALGESVIITANPYSSGFSHELFYSLDGGKTTTSITTLAAGTTSYTWTVPTSLATQMTSSTSTAITIVCDTYNGSSKVGSSKTCSFTATVPESYVPTIDSVSITEATAGLASQFGVFIQTRSTLRIVATASGSNGSTISSCSISVGGSTYSGTTVTTGVLNQSGPIGVAVTVTDSRGRTATANETITVYAYASPAITAAIVTRATSEGAASEEGTYALCNYAYSITDVNSKNTHSFKIQYLSGEAWVDLATYTDYEKAGTYLSTLTFSVDSSHQFRFVVSDFFNTYTIERTMDISFALINFGENGHSLAIGMHSPNDSHFDVNLPTRIKQNASAEANLSLESNISLSDLARQTIGKLMYPVGSIYINTTGTNPGAQFGGTWEQFGQGRTLIGAGTGNDGSTSMSFTVNSTGGAYQHTLTKDEMPDQMIGYKSGGYGLTSSAYYKGLQWVGSSTPFDLLPPYVTVYMFKRIA